METYPFTSREQVFDYLDSYASQRKEEIDRGQLGKEQGLIKSYLIETRHDGDGDPTSLDVVLGGTGWRLDSIDGESLYHVRDAGGEIGFLEPLSSRHWALHSTQATKRVDKAVNNAILNTAQLDYIWFAGSYFQAIWQNLILPQMPERFVTMKFEHLGRFDDGSWDGQDNEPDEAAGDGEWVERRASVLAITERSGQVGQFLPQLQKIHPPFNAIKMLRIPATDTRGGYDFWSRGKVTYRAPEFRDGRSQIFSIARLYEQTTRAIERRLWFQAERTHLRDGSESITFTGSPVTLTFEPPLPLSTFQNLVATTFDMGQGPLRLMGNPIRLSERKVHVYGVDLHLWQRIYLEMTPKHMTVVLPRGTCGNTIHRLVTNIQRYVAPTINVFIGDTRYSDLIQNVFLGKETM
jgi:hypothetical protein